MITSFECTDFSGGYGSLESSVFVFSNAWLFDLFEQSFKTSLPIIAMKARAKICQLLIESQVVAVAGQALAENTMPEKFNAGG